MKVRELTHKFLRDVAPHLKSGSDYEGRIRTLIDPPEYLGDMDVNAVDYDTLTQWANALHSRGTRVAYNARIVLSAVFHYAVRTGAVKNNPVRGFELPKKYRPSKKDKQNALDDSQIAYLLANIDRAVNPSVAAALKLILHTGARPSEVLGMRRSQIDGNRWTIPAELVKSGVEDTKVLNACALAVIDALPRGGDRLFETPYMTVATTLRRALTKGTRRPAKLQMKYFSAHDLRHTLATGLARLGVEERVIGAVLNHAQPQVTARYVQHTYCEQKEAALARWAEHIEGLMAREQETAA